MIRFPQTLQTSRALIAVLAAGAVGIGGSSGFAATLEDLYSVTVSRSIDPDQPLRTQEDEIRFAMGQLLTRVTGRVDTALEPVLAGMLQNAGQYVIQRGQLDRETLLVTFDARAIEAALVAREQPIWGPERPLTLLWLAIDTGQGERNILSAGEASGDLGPEFRELQIRIRDEIVAVANERGLPLTLPLMDLEDMSALSFVDIWAGFNAQVSRASTRYGADAILTGRVRVMPFGIDVRWTLLKDGGEVDLSGGSVRDGLDRLADFYAAEFSTLGATRTTLITILGVETLDDYGRVMNYLESLSILDSIGTEVDFDGATLSVRADARGSTAVLERVLALGAMLTPSTGQPDSPVEDDRLIFTLSD